MDLVIEISCDGVHNAMQEVLRVNIPFGLSLSFIGKNHFSY